MPVDVITTLNDFRRDVLNREKDSMLLMTRRWKGVEDALMPQIDALSRDIDALRAAGKDVTPGKLYRKERYKALLAQARNETAKYEDWAGRQIEQGQRDYFEMGNAAARAMLKDLLPPGVNIDFNRVPIDAVNNMIGICKDGSPLFDVLKKRALFPEAVDGMTTELINAMALGWNPTKTARAMADGLAAGLTKALVIARTEQLRAFREASYQNYKANSGIVKGWVWHSATDSRTCAACWSMHGTVHSLDERLNDHVCGRCAMVPQTKSWAELGYAGIPDTNPVIPSGEEVFKKLSEERQRAILGSGRFELWKAGKLAFGDMATFTNDPVWGRSLRVASLKDVVSEEDLRTVLGRGEKIMGHTWYDQVKSGDLYSVADARAIGNSPGGWSDYEKMVKETANEYDVRVVSMERTIGLWGTPEPSFKSKLDGGRDKVKGLASELRRVDNQKAIAVLLPKKGGEGGILTWEFGRVLSDEELDKVLIGLQKVNKELAKDVLGFEIGVTSGGKRIEYWFGDKEIARDGQILINLALEEAGQAIKQVNTALGYEFYLVEP